MSVLHVHHSASTTLQWQTAQCQYYITVHVFIRIKIFAQTKTVCLMLFHLSPGHLNIRPEYRVSSLPMCYRGTQLYSFRSGSDVTSTIWRNIVVSPSYILSRLARRALATSSEYLPSPDPQVLDQKSFTFSETVVVFLPFNIHPGYLQPSATSATASLSPGFPLFAGGSTHTHLAILKSGHVLSSEACHRLTIIYCRDKIWQIQNVKDNYDDHANTDRQRHVGPEWYQAVTIIPWWPQELEELPIQKFFFLLLTCLVDVLVSLSLWLGGAAGWTKRQTNLSRKWYCYT